MPLSYLRDEGGTFQIGDQALTVLLSNRQSEPLDKEAGGILLGRLLLDTRDVIADQASNPAPADRRGRFFFHRARRPAQDKVHAAWASSNRTAQYLGEWHTHPEADPSPSNQDLSNWSKLLRVTVCEHASLFFVIVGLERVRVWEGNRATGIITVPAPISAP